HMNRARFSRRGFLVASAFGMTAASRSARAGDDPRPPVTDPRATSGDQRHGPKWDEQFTLTVGPASGDLCGRDERVIQAAVDTVARMGGGTVRLLPGTFRLRNAVYLCSHLRLIGSGPETVLIKEASATSKLAADSDWYDQEITLANPAGFRVGDGVCLRAKNPHHGGATVIKRTLVARTGNRFRLDKGLRENLWGAGQPTAATLFPLLSGEFVTDVAIENLTLDGNKANNAELDGNYAGCIFLQDCADVGIRKVVAKNYNGDGISWQICHDVTVEACESRDHSGLGLHPGSGSQRPLIRGNKVVGNHIGIFFCWGVKYGLAEGNIVEDTKTAGISVGHRDTDNLIRGNTVRRSGKVGILFRPERGAGFTGDRNTVEGNVVVDSGDESAAAVDVQGTTAGLTFRGNELRETRGSGNRVGFRLGADTRGIKLEGNTVEGFAVRVEDRRAGK
ncbi:MAG TPA: right-handed parallel beta-helix repeat-containing protein, partial [Gemmataceae bacterium]|nr:right-handed parallel beta-helix repeat-containing protein [Gemmataceae bacterium]